MKQKVYHTLLMFSPTSGKDIVQISLSAFWWRVIYAAAGLLLVLAFAGIWIGLHHYNVILHANLLEEENRIALNKVETQKQEIDYLRDNLEKIQKQAAFIQNYLGLNPGGNTEANIGRGGGEIVLPTSPEMTGQAEINNQTLPVLDSDSKPKPKPGMLSYQDIQQLDTDLNDIINALESRHTELEHTPSLSPIDPEKAWISCGFGYRVSPFTGKKEFHPGIDIAGLKGTPILSPAKGKVVFSRTWGSMGLTIKIKHNTTFLTTYGHLLKANVQKGQSVERGETIGYMGNSGRSTGSHLHYEVSKNGKRINPFNHMLDWSEPQLLLASEE